MTADIEIVNGPGLDDLLAAHGLLMRNSRAYLDLYFSLRLNIQSGRACRTSAEVFMLGRLISSSEIMIGLDFVPRSEGILKIGKYSGSYNVITRKGELSRHPSS